MSGFLKFSSFALGNLFSKPVTSGYPFVPREYPERSKGHIEIDIDNCIFCGLCARKCPSSAITVDRATKTWTIERMGCVQCYNCVNSCAKKCLSLHPGYTEPSTEKIVDSYVQPVKEVAHGDNFPSVDESCVFCGLCARNCPQEAILVDRTAKSWKVDESKCVKCGLCLEKCPKKCIHM